jgi:hypothetical protein
MLEKTLDDTEQGGLMMVVESLVLDPASAYNVVFLLIDVGSQKISDYHSFSCYSELVLPQL